MMYGWCCRSEDDVHRLLGLFSRNARCGIRPAVNSRSRKLRYMQSQPDLVSFPRRGQAKDRKVTWTREILSWQQQVGLVNRAGMARIKKARAATSCNNAAIASHRITSHRASSGTNILKWTHQIVLLARRC